MKVQNLGITIAGVVLATTATFAGSVSAESAKDGAVEHRWVVDTQGRPPFKRERVPVETVDLASMEVESTSFGTEIVWDRDSRGRPPFKRQRVEVPVVDIASMEVTEVAKPGTNFRGRPPFRRHHR